MKKSLLIATSLFVLSACIKMPTRANTEDFKIIQKGRIAPADVLMFTDCVMDGFEKSHFILTQFNVRQSRRSTGYRVDSCAGGTSHILMSADIFDDGRVALWESSAAVLIDTKGERKAFSECLKKTKLAKKK